MAQMRNFRVTIERTVVTTQTVTVTAPTRHDALFGVSAKLTEDGWEPTSNRDRVAEAVVVE